MFLEGQKATCCFVCSWEEVLMALRQKRRDNEGRCNDKHYYHFTAAGVQETDPQFSSADLFKGLGLAAFQQVR